MIWKSIKTWKIFEEFEKSEYFCDKKPQNLKICWKPEKSYEIKEKTKQYFTSFGKSPIISELLCLSSKTWLSVQKFIWYENKFLFYYFVLENRLSIEWMNN